MSRCLIQIPIRNEEGVCVEWGGVRNKRSYANLLTDAISVGNQISTDLNRHRTQNHIRVNLMCMALPSAFIPCFFIDLENSLQKHFLSSSKQRPFFTGGIFQGPDLTDSPEHYGQYHI